jgi:hypothetical protein
MTNDVFDESRQKQKALDEQFMQLPETLIVGAVGVNGPSGGNVPPEELWSLHLELVAWREAGQPLNTSLLISRKMVTYSELKAFQEKIKGESIVAFKGKLALNTPFGTPRAELLSIVPDYEDEELLAFLDDYAKPVQITDAQFGLFVLNKRVDWFEGTAEWCGVPIDLSVNLDEGNSPDSAFQTARELWKTMEEWNQKVNAFAVSELLDLKNDNWLDEDEEEVTAEKFIRTMQLESITVYPDGSFEFWHNDGDLFLGHSIHICGSLNEGLTNADIPG